MTDTTNTKRASILKKVRALLDKAESTSFSEERDAFLNKADDLMLKYAIEEAELAKAGKGAKEDPTSTRVVVCMANNPLRESLVDIISAVAEHNRCRIVFYGLRSNKTSDLPITAVIVGFPSDLDYVEMLYTSLTLQLANELEPKPKASQSEMENVTDMKAAGLTWERIVQLLGYEYETEDGKPTPDRQRIIFGWRKYIKEHGESSQLMNNNPKTYQRSYAVGFVVEVRERLYKMRQRQSEEVATGSKALVLADRSREVDDLLKELFPRLTTTKSSTGKINPAGFARGKEAGARANLFRPGSGLGEAKRLPRS